MENNKLKLRTFKDTDVELLTTWLNKDYILKWYHDPDDWLEEINGRHDKYSWIHHFIVMKDDTPIGFCQYYDCYDANDMEDWFHVIERGDTCSIDYMIGNPDYLGRGYGKEIVAQLTKIVKNKEHAREIIVQPEKENFPSNHVLLANDYRYDEKKQYYSKLLK